MSFAKRLGLKTAASLFGLAIFGLAVTVSLNSVFGTPDHLKAALQDGKVYEVIAAEIATQLATDAHTNAGIPVDSETFQKAAKTAVTPELVQQNGEKIIDGTYSWLDGTTPTPDFQLNTGDIQKQMSANLGKAATDRVSTLPVCTLMQLQQMDTDTIDPFTIPCRPPGMNTATIRQQIEASIPTDGGLLESEIVDASDITNEQGQNVFSQADRVPGMFQLGQKLPWIFGILAILIAALIIFLNESRRRGIKSLSISLLIIGALLLVFSIVTSFIFRQIGASIGSTANEAGNTVLAITQTLVSQVNSPLKTFTVAYLLIGIIGLAALRFIKPRSHTLAPPQSPNDTSATPPTQQSTN